MNIEVGRYAGFCRGVKHAVDGAFACAREVKGELYTDGELIHNPQTLAVLQQHGVHVLAEGDSLERARGRVVIVRAHGVTPARLTELKAVAGDVRNLTCRDVGRVQAVVKRHRGSVVIFGKSDHPEVRGLLGFAREGCTVRGPAEVAALPALERVLLVSQTTMNREAFGRVAETIRSRFPDAEVVDTICDATEKRQEEVRVMAARNDCLLVIGGESSSNTRRLFEIAEERTRAHLVSDVDQVRELPLQGCRSVGITAGASTPDWMIQEVVEEVRRATRGGLARLTVGVLELGLHSSLFTAIGAFTLAFAVADILGVPFSADLAFLVSLYYLSMSLLNAYTNRHSLRLDNSRRYRQMIRWRAFFIALFATALVGQLVVALGRGPGIIVLTLFSLLLGIGYNLSYLPRVGENQRVLLFRQRDLLALKSLVIAFAVTVLLNGLPLLASHPRALVDLGSAAPLLTRLAYSFSVCYVFLLVFTRQSLFEIKTAQSDRIAGVSSLLNLMPRGAITLLLFLLPTLLLVAMGVGLVAGLYPPEKAKYFIAVGYIYFLGLMSRSRTILASTLTFELLVESNLYVAGLIALL